MRAIVAGDTIGLPFGSRLKKSYQDSLLSVCGLVTLFIGISGALQFMSSVTPDGLKFDGYIMAILTLAAGTFLGCLLDLEGKIESLGNYLQKRRERPAIQTLSTLLLSLYSQSASERWQSRAPSRTVSAGM